MPLPPGKDRRRSRCTPATSSSTASAATPEATSSPSCRRSRTSPSPKPCAWSPKSSAFPCRRSPTLRRKRRAQAKQRGGLIDIHERACAFFQEQLQASRGGTCPRISEDSRGLTPEIIAEFRIGFAPESGFLLRDALRGQFDEDIMRESGLFSWKDKDQSISDQHQSPDGQRQPTRQLRLYSKFRNRVMFPIAQRAGQGDRLHRAHAGHRREVRAEVSQLAGDADLLQVARAVQSRQGEGSHPQARLRHPGRRPDGLHLRVFRRACTTSSPARAPPSPSCRRACWAASARRSW